MESCTHTHAYTLNRQGVFGVAKEALMLRSVHDNCKEKQTRLQLLLESFA